MDRDDRRRTRLIESFIMRHPAIEPATAADNNPSIIILSAYIQKPPNRLSHNNYKTKQKQKQKKNKNKKKT